MKKKESTYGLIKPRIKYENEVEKKHWMNETK